MKQIDRTEFRKWIVSLLSSTGIDKEASDLAAEIFLRASLRHTGHHDITYLPERLDLLNKDTIRPRGQMELLQDNPVFSHYDGHGALGEYCCAFMLRKTIKKAKTYGLALSTVKNSNHFLAGHPYGQIAAEQGCMALIWSNTDPCMADPQGKNHVIGNNPIGFGAPGDGNPLVLDLCMAYASLGNLNDAALHGQDIPPYWGVDQNGQETSDPRKVLEEGVSMPVGKHKGFGLSLMHEMLTGGLSGGEMGPRITPVRGWQKHSQTILVINLQRLGASNSWEERIGTLRKDMSERIDSPIRFPGDHLYDEAAHDRKELHIPLETYKKLKAYSQEHNITLPSE